jgi:hypothetical protein
MTTYQMRKTIKLQSEVTGNLEEVRWEKSEGNNYVRKFTAVGTKELTALNVPTGKTRQKSVLTQEIHLVKGYRSELNRQELHNCLTGWVFILLSYRVSSTWFWKMRLLDYQ